MVPGFWIEQEVLEVDSPVAEILPKEVSPKGAAIFAAVPTAVTFEQSAAWACRQLEWSGESIAFTVVNSLLGGVHLSLPFLL